jgi:putative Ig domain-containing protein/BACON domain-containing protein/matrixin/Ig-like domain-containing protein/S-layer family protein
MEASMKRVPSPRFLKPLVLLVCLLASSQSISATTAIVPPDDDLIVGARVIVRGKILSIESSFDEQQGRIFTYVKLKVQEVLKGQITERKIVIKELGGRVGDRISVVYGNPEFALGEQVLMYLDTWKDGSLRTYQMFLGKFSIVKDEKTGNEFAVRRTGDEHVEVLPSHNGQQGAAITNRMEISAYIAMVKSRLAANVKPSRTFEQTYYSNVPTLASPPGYVSDSRKGEVQPEFNLFNPPVRWFEPDTGQPVTYTLNPHPSTDPGIPALVVDPVDIAAAANSWSTVPGCSLHISYAGTLDDCYTFTGTPGINVVSNNCDGRNSPTTGCAGILAWGGYSGAYYSPITINGTVFQYRITQGFVSCNPWAACNFSDHCSVQFIVTHEMGHSLGLGHSQYQQATMYAIAYYIARCAVIWSDDQDAIKFVYPGGGGPGLLSITTTSLANGTVGTAYSQSVLATGGTLPYTWSLVQGQGTLPPGLSLNAASGLITGTPTTAGTYNFTAKVTDAASATAQKALSIVVVTGGGGGGPYNSQFISQTVPATVPPGQSFSVNMKFLNTGTQTWAGSDFYLASQNPALNQTWGGNGVTLSAFLTNPGQQLDLTFTASAPFAPGPYNFQWQLYKNDGATNFFGQMSANVVIQVGAGACPTSVSPASQSFNPSFATGSFSVTADAGCNWTAVSNAAWITITAGSGAGNGSVSYSVGANAGSSIRNGTITIGNQTFTVYQGLTFTDVALNNPFYDEIGRLSARSVTLGCGDGNFCPNAPVTREQMAAFIVRSLGEFNPPLPATQRFTDVPPTNPFYNFIDRMAALNITLGCGGGNYCPTSPVLREQMAAFIVRALGEPDPPNPPSQRFNDVPSSNQFYNFIDRMAVLNITQGCSVSPPMYCPGGSVTRGQMAAFLVRAFNL